MAPPIPLKATLKNPLYFFAVGFGSGLLPKMPGTWGTVMAIPFYLLMRNLSPSNYLLVTAAAFFVGIWFCHATEKAFGVPDHPRIVWDEIVGYWCTMFMAPQGWLWIVLGFILFRIFDIAKPWPICFFNKRVKGGFGIMLDDVLAAIPAWGILYILHVVL